MIGVLIPGFKIEKVVHQNFERQLFVGKNEASNNLVLIKVSRGKINPREQLARYKREQSIIKRLDLDLMVKPIDIINIKGNPVMILENFGNGLLKDLPNGEALCTEDFLKFPLVW